MNLLSVGALALLLPYLGLVSLGARPDGSGPVYLNSDVGRTGSNLADLAEREGFEPSRPLRAYGISSAAPSTELGDRSAAKL